MLSECSDAFSSNNTIEEEEKFAGAEGVWQLPAY